MDIFTRKSGSRATAAPMTPSLAVDVPDQRAVGSQSVGRGADILALLMGSSIGQKMVADHNATETAQRKVIIDELERTEAAGVLRNEQLRDNVTSAYNRLIAVRAALREAEVEHAHAVGALIGHSSTAENAMNSLREKLAETAHPELDTFEAELRNHLHYVKRLDPARRAVVQEILNSTLPALRLEADQSAVPEKLNEIRKNLSSWQRPVTTLGGVE